MTKEQMMEQANALLEAHSCCEELKVAAQNWLSAIGTEDEKAAAAALVAECEEDVMTVDQVIVAMESEGTIAALGAELCAQIGAHAKEIKAAGAVYCDCPACTAGLAIMQNKDVIL